VSGPLLDIHRVCFVAEAAVVALESVRDAGAGVLDRARETHGTGRERGDDEGRHRTHKRADGEREARMVWEEREGEAGVQSDRVEDGTAECSVCG
jgi:hypothetical protein